METRNRVVIIGGGFGGITAAKELMNKDVDIYLIDRTNYHLFQPLLYQVATAALSPGDIAVPIRSMFHGRKNVKIIMAEVLSIDKQNSFVQLSDRKISFDYLILSPGSSHSYFGNNKWESWAPGLKSLRDALSIREKILTSLEEAEITDDPEIRKRNLTFVVIGGGPTGVEMAGSIAEIAKQTMMKDFRNIKAEDTEVILVEAASAVLTAYSPPLSSDAREALEKLGVNVMLNTKVTDINEGAVTIGDKRIETPNIIWAAGNEASPLLKSLDAELDRAGRVVVEPDLTVKGSPNIFVIGDAAHAKDNEGSLLPGIAPVAMQQGKYAAKLILEIMRNGKRKPFEYFDKGMMATIGRAKAVAKIRRLEFSGFFAWFLWSFIHIFFLITFRNRVRVMAEWIWYYFTSRRGVRLITKKTSPPENIEKQEASDKDEYEPDLMS